MKKCRASWTDALSFCLPVIFEYDSSTATRLTSSLSYTISSNAWHSVVLWTLCRSFLGDHHCESESLRVRVDYPTLKSALTAAREIQHDVLLCDAIEAMSSAVRVSFRSRIDLVQAADILEDLDHLASSHLPEPSGRNIHHKGYLGHGAYAERE